MLIKYVNFHLLIIKNDRIKKKGTLDHCNQPFYLFDTNNKKNTNIELHFINYEFSP